MTAKAINKTVDLFPDLTPYERHVLFLESLTGQTISQGKRKELLTAHFNDSKQK